MKRFALALVLVAAAPEARPAPENSPLTLERFLAEVGRGNLELEAQRYDLPVAEAQVEVARVFPDWSLSGGLGSYELTHTGVPTSAALALDVPLEIAGKRGRRIEAATQQARVASATLADALRVLRRDAASDFIDAIHARLVAGRKRQTLEGLNKLVAYNQEAVRVGQVGAVALVQSRVEARKFEIELASAEAMVRQADLQLALRMGLDARAPLPGAPSADLKGRPHAFQLEALLREASDHRPDLLAARRAVAAAEAQLALTRTNRWTDLTVGAGYSHGFAGVPPNYPAAPFDSISLTLGITLPVSRLFYQGDVTAAALSEEKARSLARAAQHAAEIEIETALQRYRVAEEVVARYDQGILSDSEQVVSAMFYSYQRGGISQLEVIAAQRDLDGVYLSYFDALQERARALVAVEQAADARELSL